MVMDLLVESALKASREGGMNEPLFNQALIKVVGVGGGGNNMGNWLFKKGVKGAEVILANTDQIQLNARNGDKKILIGKELTKGLGAGGFPEKGKMAAEESSRELKDSLRGADLVFVCAGLGGGTGTGAAPVIAKLAKDMGAIVISTVTMPFKTERKRVESAEAGLEELRNSSDTVIVIDNNRLVSMAGNLPIDQAFNVANEVVATMIKGIVETISDASALVHLDFADIKAIMNKGGVSVIGIGETDASDSRVTEVVRRALNNPLLDVSYKGAKGALIHISGGPDLTLAEVNQIGEMATQSLDPDAVVIWGAKVDESLSGKLRVMTIITGVSSPYLLGPEEINTLSKTTGAINQELGIEILK
ncbi:cell division protein FtsZ [Candidatus Parvarchaeota archaeon]|nr:cell division protein FtsZ [Candidatus Parvarchaeota archaeon]